MDCGGTRTRRSDADSDGPRNGAEWGHIASRETMKEPADTMHDDTIAQEQRPAQESGTPVRPFSGAGVWANRIPWISGFPILAVMTVVLFALSKEQGWLAQPLVGAVIKTPIIALLLLTLGQEVLSLSEVEASDLVSRPALLNFSGVVGGALTTYVLSCDLGLGAVVAAGLIGLLGALIFPDQAVPIYCGAFVGMVSPELLDNLSHVLIAAVIAGIVFDLSTGVLDGFGGKLGTIAFTGTVITPLLLQCEFCPAELPSGPVAWQIIVVSVLAAVGTYWLSVTLEHGAVVGSAVVGIAGGLLLPAVAPEVGGLLAVVAICASFTGMSSPKRIPNFFWMTLAGLVTGIVFIYSQPVLGGAGGKLGTLAFGSAMVSYSLRGLLERIGVTV